MRNVEEEEYTFFCIKVSLSPVQMGTENVNLEECAK